MALKLKRKGIKRVFPLTGGLEAWMLQGFDVEEHTPELAKKETNVR